MIKRNIIINLVVITVISSYVFAGNVDLPDVSITGDDMQKIDIEDKTNVIEKGDDVKFDDDVDIREVDSVEIDDKKSMKRLLRGLSSEFSISYGLYESIDIDFNLGKQEDKFNYIIGYTRNFKNNHKKIKYWDDIENSKRSEDRVNIGLDIKPKSTLIMNYSFFLIQSSIGLQNITNYNKRDRTGVEFEPSFKIKINPMSHFIIDSKFRYNRHFLESSGPGDLVYNYYGGLKLGYEISWSEVNYLNIDFLYAFDYSRRDKNKFENHFGNIGIIDKILIARNFHLLMGVKFYLNSKIKEIEFGNLVSPIVSLSYIIKSFSIEAFFKMDNVRPSFENIFMDYDYILPDIHINQWWFLESGTEIKFLAKKVMKYKTKVSYIKNNDKPLYYKTLNLFSAVYKDFVCLLLVNQIDFNMGKFFSLMFGHKFQYPLGLSEKLPYFPYNTGFTKLDFHHKDSGINVSADLEYIDRRYNISINDINMYNRLKGHWLLNLYYIHKITNTFDIFLKAKNCLNIFYQEWYGFINPQFFIAAGIKINL